MTNLTSSSSDVLTGELMGTQNASSQPVSRCLVVLKLCWVRRGQNGIKYNWKGVHRVDRGLLSLSGECRRGSQMGNSYEIVGSSWETICWLLGCFKSQDDDDTANAVCQVAEANTLESVFPSWQFLRSVNTCWSCLISQTDCFWSRICFLSFLSHSSFVFPDL